ncbi:MAG: hypothetical protein ACP6IS_12385 [Candidatus Asgardarchaeia archaeon]
MLSNCGARIFFERSVSATMKAIRIIDENKENLKLSNIEQKYITKIKEALLNIP